MESSSVGRLLSQGGIKRKELKEQGGKRKKMKQNNNIEKNITNKSNKTTEPQIDLRYDNLNGEGCSFWNHHSPTDMQNQKSESKRVFGIHKTNQQNNY